MRPRSRPMSKRRLQLPTIREGSEEAPRDPPQPPASVCSQDYLLSICHLALPTFPAPPGGGAPDPLELLYGGTALSSCWEGGGEERRRRRSVGGQSGEEGLSGWRGDRDDRDGREGRRRARANSVPRLTSPNCPPRRKGSCPEVHPLPGPQTPAHPPAAPPDGPPVPEVRDSPEEETGGRGERGGAEEEQDPGGKPSLLSQWLSDCRSAWRVTAGVLPAIAEI
ncbi:uncharacterized protein si:dkeyp-72g9.4 [Gadus chalcogrammus]|uniref:uncharacterized protein si:dkeyp-72g9.4 n=1 Tax=Gadus chalcogrammus TaxID=1042646 RepID=UPI0024C4DF26|nr:uncharacterized protein si:dkeyp-72g9.4 [Gadus chalcogrammus]XP_056456285.1 uncharacterized protein si:dkeyp-72g9.4 [Gadus chalcogrammus]